MFASRADVLPVGPPVQARYQIGREGEISRLVEELSEREHTVMSGPRRIGKSTVALAALESMAQEGAVVCAIDCRETTTVAALILELDAQRVANQPEFRRRARGAGGFVMRLLRTLLASEEHPDPDVNLAEAVAEQLIDSPGSKTVTEALLRVEASAGPRGAVVFFDEAHVLNSLPDAVQAVRARMNARDRAVTFLFAGSEESMMESLFAEGGLLEVQGQPFELPDIPAHMWMEGLRSHCRDYLGVSVDRDAVGTMLEASGGHPFRTMLVANRALARAKELVETRVDDALAHEVVARARRDHRWGLP